MMRVVNSRLGFLSVFGLLTAAFLAVPQAASASTAHSRTNPAAGVKVLGQQASPAAADATTKAVSPRLSLPGCSSQDGFNGNVEWGSSSPGYIIKAWGEVWDLCGTDADVYISYDVGNIPFNPHIGTSGYDYTSGVNWGPQTYYTDPYSISVTVCAEWQSKWRCGTPYHVPGS